MGVQFTVPAGFNLIFFSRIWELYHHEFPRIEEQPRLEPQFETFGGNPGSQQLSINFGPPFSRNRLWFVSSDDSHLLQVQDDRFLLNWRNRNNGTSYPRHREMIKRYEKYLSDLNKLFLERFSQPLFITQAEVTYVNIIKIDEFKSAGEWLNILDFSKINPEGFMLNFSELIEKSGKPIGRFYSEINAIYSQDGNKKAIRWGLTVRGKPETTSLASALEFITYSRDRIVHRFCDLTPSSAHEVWGRTS